MAEISLPGMILVTVGSTQFPFARMNALVGRLSARNKNHELIIFQYGNLAPQYYYPPIELYPYIPQEKLLQYMKQAQSIICHGGPGTIYQALSFGKIPWVLPRQRRYGEHLTDHQVDFSNFMSRRKLVNIISDTTPLKTIEKGSPLTIPPRRDNHRLIGYLNSLMSNR